MALKSPCPRLFLKLNYRTKFPSKNNQYTDPCLPANDQKMVCQTLVFNKLYFQHSMIFRPVLIQKNGYLQLMTSIIYRLDIALTAPKNNSLIFLMSAKKGRETTN